MAFTFYVSVSIAMSDRCLAEMSSREARPMSSRNLQILATEMFKVRNGLAPEITNSVFQINPSVYNLRNSEFKTENVKTVHYGTESLSFLGPRIWKLVPLEIKKSTSLQIFKNKIKTWAPENCPCRLCKTYVQGVGFV